MPAGAGEGEGGRIYHGSGARKSGSEEFIVGELEEGLRVPLLSGREKDELGFDDEGEDNSSSDAEPCPFLDLFVLADKVCGVRKTCMCGFGTHVHAEFLQYRQMQPKLISSFTTHADRMRRERGNH